MGTRVMIELETPARGLAAHVCTQSALTRHSDDAAYRRAVSKSAHPSLRMALAAGAGVPSCSCSTKPGAMERGARLPFVPRMRDANGGRIRLRIERRDPQAAEPPFECGQQLGQGFGRVDHGAGSRRLRRGGQEADPGVEPALGHGAGAMLAGDARRAGNGLARKKAGSR